jgi:hypothetical protein
MTSVEIGDALQTGSGSQRLQTGRIALGAQLPPVSAELRSVPRGLDLRVIANSLIRMRRGPIGRIVWMLSREEHEVLQEAELSGWLIQRTTSEASQRRYVLHRAGCSQEAQRLDVIQTRTEGHG